jgi:hypothetical protein
MTLTAQKTTLGLAAPVLALALSFGARTASADIAREGDLHIEKNCSQYSGAAGSFCTIISSNLAALPVHSRIFYDQAAGVPNPNPPGGMLDSNILIYVGPGNWAVGRCTLDNNTNLGLCSLSDGVGPLTGITMRVTVSSPDGINYFWNGTYAFRSLFH